MSIIKIPKGYRQLGLHEVIQSGDKYWDAEEKEWTTSVNQGRRVDADWNSASRPPYIRKVSTEVPNKPRKARKVTRKSPKSSHTTFTVPIYNCEVTLAVTKDLRDVPFEVTEEDREDYITGAEATVFEKDRKLMVAFKPGLLSHDTIAHELFHVTHYILSRANVRLTKKSDEAHAYLAGFLAGETYKALKTITKERIK